jgi:outer membrane protein assembly factor BamB
MYTIQRNSGGLVTSNVKVFPTDSSELIASPSLTTGSVVSACGTNLSITKKYNNLFMPTSNGNLFKVAQDWNDNLSLKWETHVSTAKLLSAPAVIKDVIFVGSDDHNFSAVSNNGAVLFKFPTGSVIDSGPAISNGRVYFGSADFNVYCLSINGL